MTNARRTHVVKRFLMPPMSFLPPTSSWARMGPSTKAAMAIVACTGLWNATYSVRAVLTVANACESSMLRSKKINPILLWSASPWSSESLNLRRSFGRSNGSPNAAIATHNVVVGCDIGLKLDA